MKKLLVPILLSLGTYASAAFLPSTSTIVNQGYPGTVDWPMRLSTTTVPSATINTGTGVYTVGGAANGATITGNPLAPGVDVASSSIPSGVANGKIAYQMGDSFGRVAVTGMPYGVIFSTYMVQISSSLYGIQNQKDAVLVSSAGANLYTYLCGCVFTNTTATNGKVILASPVNAVSNSTSYAVGTAESHYMTIGIPANYVPTGIWPGCSQPFFRSALNTSISIIQTVATSVQNVDVYCNYFVGQ